MKNKKKRKSIKRLRSALKVTLISLLMVFAAISGVYCAKIYTTPYSNDVILGFHSDTLDEVEINKEKCNILIMGLDKSGTLTDVMMLAQIDPVNNKATVMSIPRDTYFRFDGTKTRINRIHSRKGSEGSILAVKELTGVPIHHYVKVNTKAFRQCIDELGGVEFDVPQRMYYRDPAQGLYIDLMPGKQLLDGDKSEQLVRFRDTYKMGDLDRIKVQQNFLHALAEQKLKIGYVGKIDDIYSVIIENLETSMSPGDFVQCGTQLLDIGTENIKTVVLPNTLVDGQPYVLPLYSEIEDMRKTEFGYDE
jgi:LCP family protein required for cell wall assembly